MCSKFGCQSHFVSFSPKGAHSPSAPYCGYRGHCSQLNVTRLVLYLHSLYLDCLLFVLVCPLRTPLSLLGGVCDERGFLSNPCLPRWCQFLLPPHPPPSSQAGERAPNLCSFHKWRNQCVPRIGNQSQGRCWRKGRVTMRTHPPFSADWCRSLPGPKGRRIYKPAG